MDKLETATLLGAGKVSAKKVECRAGDEVGTQRDAVLRELEAGEAAKARALMEEIFAADASASTSDEWAQLRETGVWPDGWLIAAVRRDPPDEAALDVLVSRYWQTLFGRCQMLTLNLHSAHDLAQETWWRVLRARHSLKPSGNFPAYLVTVATNLWRDTNRSARRAGPLADQRLASLDALITTEEGDGTVLGDILPDLNSLEAEERKVLSMDIDRAMSQLTPHLHDVLVARFIAGESCAEIGRRYGRTEQSVSGWVREAARQMKLYLEKSCFGEERKGE